MKISTCCLKKTHWLQFLNLCFFNGSLPFVAEFCIVFYLFTEAFRSFCCFFAFFWDSEAFLALGDSFWDYNLPTLPSYSKGLRFITFFSASDASLNDCTYCFILLLGDFSVLPVLGGSRVFGGRCLFAEVLSEALGSAWLIPVEDGALDTYCRSETLLPRCYSFLVDCIKVGSVI